MSQCQGKGVRHPRMWAGGSVSIESKGRGGGSPKRRRGEGAPEKGGERWIVFFCRGRETLGKPFETSKTPKKTLKMPQNPEKTQKKTQKLKKKKSPKKPWKPCKNSAKTLQKPSKTLQKPSKTLQKPSKTLKNPEKCLKITWELSIALWGGCHCFLEGIRPYLYRNWWKEVTIKQHLTQRKSTACRLGAL